MTEIQPEDLINGFNASKEASEKLTTPGYELHSELIVDGKKVDVPIEVIDSFEPIDDPEKPGRFIMNLKKEIVEHKGLIMVITGGSLLALGGLIRQKRKSSKD